MVVAGNGAHALQIRVSRRKHFEVGQKALTNQICVVPPMMSGS